MLLFASVAPASTRCKLAVANDTIFALIDGTVRFHVPRVKFTGQAAASAWFMLDLLSPQLPNFGAIMQHLIESVELAHRRKSTNLSHWGCFAFIAGFVKVAKSAFRFLKVS